MRSWSIYIRCPALFKVSGIRPDRASLSGRIPDIFKVQAYVWFREIAQSRLGKNKLYLFDLCEKTWCKFKNFNFVETLYKK